MKKIVTILSVLFLLSCSSKDPKLYRKKLQEIEESYKSGRISEKNYFKQKSKIYQSLTSNTRKSMTLPPKPKEPSGKLSQDLLAKKKTLP